jgi:hypothetical protein
VSNLALPEGVRKEPRIGVQPHDAQFAFPVAMTLPVGNDIISHVWGGMTKLEQGALQIAAGLTGDPKDIATRAVEVAKAVLDECRKPEPTELEEA